MFSLLDFLIQILITSVKEVIFASSLASSKSYTCDPFYLKYWGQTDLQVGAKTVQLTLKEVHTRFPMSLR